jgi:hypothetical protein
MRLADLSPPFQEFIRVFIRYIRNPVREIQHLPDWSWRDLLIFQVGFTAATGAASGLLKSQVLSVFYGALIVPVMTGLTILVASLFFYFFFQVFAGQTLSFRKINTIVFFANIPFFIFQMISHWFPPISLVGLAFAGLILIVGFTEHFAVDRKLIAKMVVGVYLLFVLMWAWSRFDASEFESALERRMDAPEVILGQ